MVTDLPEAEPAQPDCPLVKHPVLPRCDPRELQPLLDHLGGGTLASAPTRFPIGTLLPDGRQDLCKQGLGVEGTQAVLGALRDHPHVSSLLLGTNGMGDVGAAAVAELVRHNPRIRTVYLGCNLIGPEGTRQLADAVRIRPSVEGLWLKRNPLGAQGTTLLADAVATSALRTLDLVDTGLGEAGLAALVEQLLARDAPLEWLYLSGNRLTARAARPLAELLRKSPRLLGLYLAANPGAPGSAQQVRAGGRGGPGGPAHGQHAPALRRPAQQRPVFRRHRTGHRRAGGQAGASGIGRRRRAAQAGHRRVSTAPGAGPERAEPGVARGTAHPQRVSLKGTAPGGETLSASRLRVPSP
ncbi:hypothetical protein OV208_18300 [Corallococcus sp. bb12-1]|uniref:hypothetical protein n=1 Tax=Corallococcus sp. bb12-1 TaxID=2996784 RepID=UPI00226DA994|nr:hypothetical protein [Corallococcus sp. bb12-1]MCY1043274.1 hypothetical protein [Corallococcus sp. bb12-1]